MSRFGVLDGFSSQTFCLTETTHMTVPDLEFTRIPGLFRLWDIQLVINPEEDWHIHYAEMSADGTPLFLIYRRTRPGEGLGA